MSERIESPGRKAREDDWDAARDVAAESAVLACCILLGRSVTKPALTVGDFTESPHQTLWKAFKLLERGKTKIDAVFLQGALSDMQLWGWPEDGPEHVSAGLIAKLLHWTPTAARIDEYAARVREMTARRAALNRAEKELQRGRGR